MKKCVAAVALSALITGVALGQSQQPYAGLQARLNHAQRPLGLSGSRRSITRAV